MGLRFIFKLSIKEVGDMSKVVRARTMDRAMPVKEDEKSVNVVINVARMDLALKTERFKAPSGMTREQIRQYIIAAGK